jgi:osmotically-inducible protein OsmY
MKKLALLILMLSTILSSGCLPTIIGTAATGVVSVGQDRKFSELKGDIEIWTSIKNQFIQYNSRDLFKNVSVKVIEGRVLLTGNVEKAKTKALAEKISWIPNGVVEVINEIDVNDDNGLKTSAKDMAITTHIKTRLALEKNIKSNNYKIETVSGVVYVIGTTKSQEELSKAIDIISKVSGVKRVVNYVLIKE